MHWTTPVDGYCDRLDASFWAEPVNAVTNAAFLAAALGVALRLGGAGLPLAWALAWTLVGLLAATGTGSFLFHTFLFHTFAQPWAGIADTLPILLFILTGLFAATRDVLGTSQKVAGLVTAGFFPYAATIPLFRLIPGLGGSAGYAPVPLLMVIHAALLWRRAGATARGLLLTVVLLAASITARARSAAVRRVPARHALCVAPHERGRARLDDRDLPAAHGSCRGACGDARRSPNRVYAWVNTTILTPFINTRPCRCSRTARASTRASISRPTAT